MADYFRLMAKAEISVGAYPCSSTELTLTFCFLDLTAEDSGNYTCEIRGRKSIILAHVTHYVFVRGNNNNSFPKSNGAGAGATTPTLTFSNSSGVGKDA